MRTYRSRPFAGGDQSPFSSIPTASPPSRRPCRPKRSDLPGQGRRPDLPRSSPPGCGQPGHPASGPGSGRMAPAFSTAVAVTRAEPGILEPPGLGQCHSHRERGCFHRWSGVQARAGGQPYVVERSASPAGSESSPPSDTVVPMTPSVEERGDGRPRWPVGSRVSAQPGRIEGMRASAAQRTASHLHTPRRARVEMARQPECDGLDSPPVNR